MLGCGRGASKLIGITGENAWITGTGRLSLIIGGRCGWLANQ